MVSGAGRKIFQPGEVLTASNVQNYLQDQAVQYYAGTAARGSAIGTATTEGMMSYLADTNSVQMATGTATWVNVDGIPIVAGTAARADLYPSPVLGNTVFRSDTGLIETYYTAYGTANPGGRTPAGWYTGQNGGLVPITPTSIAVASGSASVSENGLITLTNAATIDINGVFSSAFEHYKITFIGTTNTATYLQTRFRNTGTAAGGDSTADYVLNQQYQSDTTAPTKNSLTSYTYTSIGSIGSVYSVVDATIYSPFLSVYTGLTSLYSYTISSTQSEWGLMGGRKQANSSWSGISFSTGAAINGRIRIYGIK